MFICKERCIDKYEGLAVDLAKKAEEIGMAEGLGRLGMSYGPCEVCGQVGGCYDIPSSANFRLKEQGEQDPEGEENEIHHTHDDNSST